jgi:hypothetical protein
VTPDVSNLDCGIPPKLVRNAGIPLVAVDIRLNGGKAVHRGKRHAALGNIRGIRIAQSRNLRVKQSCIARDAVQWNIVGAEPYRVGLIKMPKVARTLSVWRETGLNQAGLSKSQRLAS